MTHRAIVGTLVLALFVGLFSAARSSPLLGSAQPKQAAATSGAPTVEVLATVTHKNGKSVTGLTRADFKVFEDGKPQTITGFADASTLVSAIVILLDRSGSTRDSEQDPRGGGR